MSDKQSSVATKLMSMERYVLTMQHSQLLRQADTIATWFVVI